MLTLSYSAAQKYLTSPMSWFMHYLMRWRPTETGSALIFGGAVDEGLNSLLRDLKDKNEPNLAAAKDAFATEYDKRILEGGIIFTKADQDESLLTDDDRWEGYKENIPYLCLRRKGFILIEEYAAQVLPRIQEVVLVQHQIELKNDVGDKFTGIVDILIRWEDGKLYVADNKTTSVKYATNSASESAQLATYWEALRDEYKPDGVMFITIPKSIRKRKLPRVEIGFYFGTISEALLAATFADYDKVVNGIKSGKLECSGCRESIFPCPYRRYCESGGRDLSGLAQAKKTDR